MGEKNGRVVVVTNQKGGVGKTTLARNLGECLFGRGYSVIMIDFDTQGSLSLSCGIKNFKNLTYEETIAYPFVSAVQGKGGNFPIIHLKDGDNKRLDLIPANKTLYQIAEVLKKFDKETKYKALKWIVTKLKPYYDFILIDTPPTISEMLQNAIAAADECILISSPESFSLDGIIESYDTICDMSIKTNTNISIAGVVINDYTSNRAHQDHVIKQIKRICDARGIHVFDTIIPRAASIEEAMSDGKGVINYKFSSDKARDAFVKVTDEFIKRDMQMNKEG